MPICESHEEIVRKLDRIGYSLENGIRADVQEAIIAIKSFEETCKGFHNRLIILESFGWFREWVTKLRDNLFKNTVKLICTVIFLLFMLHTSEKVVSSIVSQVIK